MTCWLVTKYRKTSWSKNLRKKKSFCYYFSQSKVVLTLSILLLACISCHQKASGCSIPFFSSSSILNNKQFLDPRSFSHPQFSKANVHKHQLCLMLIKSLWKLIFLPFHTESPFIWAHSSYGGVLLLTETLTAAQKSLRLNTQAGTLQHLTSSSAQQRQKMPG